MLLERVIDYRNQVIHGVYRHALRPWFFRTDPELIHQKMARFGARLGRSVLGRRLTQSLLDYQHPRLAQKIFGLHFRNPIGLSAGFDKNAELTDILPAVGFGFAEVGSITGLPCAGNPGTRLWRLPKSQSIVVNYGLKNDGCESVAARLSGKSSAIPLGVSVAMTNCADNLRTQNAVRDFAKAFRVMEPRAQYLTVNISCPNLPGGQLFMTPHQLDYLLDILDEIPTAKPVFLKLSPDLGWPTLDALLAVAHRHRVVGLVCTNLTKNRTNAKIRERRVPAVGGLSGKVVQDLADQMLSHIYKQHGDRFVLIGSGGVSNAADAYQKIRRGASLVQLITGLIFEGPQLVSSINRGLVALLERDGFSHIGQAVGADTI